MPDSEPFAAPAVAEHDTLKYSLLGPSLTKAGQDSVDQAAVSEIIYNASKGSKYFANEEAKDLALTQKITAILAKKAQLEKLDLAHDRRKADDYLATLEASRDLSQTIVHIDCDAFYAAVEELDQPHLKDLPFSVGKGVLTTCNYHARKFGCRSGMAGFVAKKLCPQLIQIPLNFDKYTAKAQEVREVLVNYDPRFESASIDEAYVNITAYCERTGMDAEEAVEKLCKEVHKKTRITVSAGIAANAKLAKICSNMNKPNGQYALGKERETIMEFMRTLPTRKVNGIGRVFERELDATGVKTCGDIYEQRQYLAKLFGEKAWMFLAGCYLGLGKTEIRPAEEYERKSVGTESTFNEMGGHEALREKLRHIAEELEKDMRRTGFKGRTLVLKVKMHTYEVFTRQVVPPKAVFLADDLYRYALPMLKKLEEEYPGMKLRLMGLRCTNLVSTKKPDAMSFLGFRRRPEADTNKSPNDDDVNEGNSRKRKAAEEDNKDDGEWEAFPDADFEEAAKAERDADMQELEALSQLEEADQRRHGREILPNPTPKDEPPAGDAGVQEEWWDCPICMRPQKTDEREFNEHIDLCLSRGTIKEVVKDAAGVAGTSKTGTPEKKEGSMEARKPESKKAKTGSEKKKVGPAQGTVDKRQGKLSFGPKT